MESQAGPPTRDNLAAQLRAAEHGEAAGWLAWSQGPAWFPAALGVWAAVLVLALGYLDSRPRSFVMLALTAVSLGYVSWQTRRHGAWPTATPRGFGRSTTFFVAGLLALLLLGAVGFWTVPSPWVAAVAVGVATAGWAWGYGSLYAADAARLRARFGVAR